MNNLVRSLAGRSSFAVVLVLACFQLNIIAQDCKKFVNYDGGTLKFTGGIHALSLGIDSEKKTLQTATDLAQIFDGYQYATCQDIRHLRQGTSQYDEAVRKRSDATLQLSELMVVLSRYKENQNDDAFLKLINSVTSSAPNAQKLQTEAGEKSQIKNIPLTQDLKAASPEFTTALERLKPASGGVCTWDYVSEENKRSVFLQQKEAVGRLSLPLNLLVDQIRTYVFVPCSDGRLHVAIETKGLEQRLKPEGVRVLPFYGFVGVAYASGTEQIGTLPQVGESVKFQIGKDPQSIASQESARRILIEPEDILKINAAWIVAIPLKNAKREVIGVMSLSSDTPRQDTQLYEAYYRNKTDMDDLTQEISSLLTASVSTTAAKVK